MEWFCDVCDKTIKNDRMVNIQSLRQNGFEKRIRLKHIIQSSDFFNIVEIFHENVNHHNKKFELHLVKKDFKLIFNIE